ncbi:MAG: tRNA (guanosine(46)-N7)-methyltransferase TrmB [Rhabdochlamydiaceae bacterium]
MKHSQLLYPHSWNERQPAWVNDVLFVPQHYFDHERSLAAILSQSKISQHSHVCLEYCSGNGDWIIEKARTYSDSIWIAVEKRFDRVKKIFSKKDKLKIENLIIVCGDALTFTEYYLPKECISKIFVNFPDPWPKDRHHKHRLFQKEFIQQLYRVGQQKCSIVLATDHLAYTEEVIGNMQKEQLFHPIFPFPHYINEWPQYGDSFFDTLWRAKGCEIYYTQFTKG